MTEYTRQDAGSSTEYVLRSTGSPPFVDITSSPNAIYGGALIGAQPMSLSVITHLESRVVRRYQGDVAANGAARKASESESVVVQSRVEPERLVTVVCSLRDWPKAVCGIREFLKRTRCILHYPAEPLLCCVVYVYKRAASSTEAVLLSILTPKILADVPVSNFSFFVALSLPTPSALSLAPAAIYAVKPSSATNKRVSEDTSRFY